MPQALCVSYATLIWASREAEVVLMFAGQMGCEALNFVLKRIVKEERPKRRYFFADVLLSDTKWMELTTL